MANPTEAHRQIPAEARARFTEATKAFPKVELGMLGEKIPVMYAGWGEHLSTDEMLTRWSTGAPPAELVDTIKAYGVSGGYFDGEGFDKESPEGHERSIANMTAMTESLMRLRGWDHAGLRLATISEHPGIAAQVSARLREKGLEIDDVVTYALACDGGGGAIIDALADKRMKGKQTVVVAAENLTGKSVPRENIAMSTLFGNGGGGIAFIPGEEMSLVHPDLVQAVVKPDKLGVIEIPRVYEIAQLKESGEQVSTSAWYDVDPDASFFHGSSVVANEMTTAGPVGAMKRETGVVFRNLVQPLTERILNRFYGYFPDDADRLKTAIFHQPSKTIVTNLAVKLRKIFGYRCPEIPWFMEETGFNNISSGNIFIALTEAAKKEMLSPGEAFLLGTFGIGLSAHLAVAQMSPSGGRSYRNN